MGTASTAPLHDLDVVVRADGAAAAYAGRLLCTLGAATTFLEPPEGSPLRREPPWLDEEESISALYSWLVAGADVVESDLKTDSGHASASRLLGKADIFIDDTAVAVRPQLGLDPDSIGRRFPQLVHVSVLPFGAEGDKASWKAEDINLQHASGEGNLLPNGLSIELFPERPPVKIYGHFAEYQGGIAAALGALSAIWSRTGRGGQFVDVSCQDAALAVGAFAIQRFGDGAIERRAQRSFRYGGVLECRDGYAELLTLEQRQWQSLVRLLGNPEWAQNPVLDDALERSRQGPAINAHVRAWAKDKAVAEIVARGQAAGVPIAPYNMPSDVLRDPHERRRGLFAPVAIDGVGTLDMLTAPFRFGKEALTIGTERLELTDATAREA